MQEQSISMMQWVHISVVVRKGTYHSRAVKRLKLQKLQTHKFIKKFVCRKSKHLKLQKLQIQKLIQKSVCKN